MAAEFVVVTVDRQAPNQNPEAYCSNNRKYDWLLKSPSHAWGSHPNSE